MIQGVLVDTSVWVDHFRFRNEALVRLLQADLVMTHPMIRGEIACGTPPSRQMALNDLAALQQPRLATITESIELIERESLFGTRCGLIDVILLACVLISPGTQLWSFDKPLVELAGRFSVAYQATI